MRRWFAAAALLLFCGPAFAWELDASKEPQTGVPIARMGGASIDGSAIAILKCRGGPDPKIAFGIWGAEKPLPLGALRAGYLTYKIGRMKPYTLSTRVDDVNGAQILTSSTDEDKDIMRLAFYMANIKDEIIITGADGAEWLFKSGAAEASGLMSHCGIISNEPTSGLEATEAFKARAQTMTARDRAYAEKVAFRKLVQCAVYRITTLKVPIPLSQKTAGDAAQGECFDYAATYMRFCMFNNAKKPFKSREIDCWDEYRGALALIDAGKRRVSDYDPGAVRY